MFCKRKLCTADDGVRNDTFPEVLQNGKQISHKKKKTNKSVHLNITILFT